MSESYHCDVKDCRMHSGQLNHGLCRNCEYVMGLRTEIEALAKERDLYKKAKDENDERFMLERDEARAEAATLRTQLAGVTKELGAYQDMTTKYLKAFKTLKDKYFMVLKR